MRLPEFRNMRLQDVLGVYYALGLCAERETLFRLEGNAALATKVAEQSPIGPAVLDREVRYVAVNAVLADMDGIPAEQRLDRKPGEVLPRVDAEQEEALLRQVRDSGVPILDQEVVGRTPADPGADHAWSLSMSRLEASSGEVLGVTISLIDITDRYLTALQAEESRRRLALVADASVRIGTTLALEQTARAPERRRGGGDRKELNN
ncbi:PAS domain-containing protein [Streptomyces durhamensis]|uniref:PAS domain-containing protein n=1 Tax=Streptomyces durhamensis TaxID=68194 RepID=UPI0004CD6BBE|nr:PAS domain-containing protein [Streptomyces durhamensis]